MTKLRAARARARAVLAVLALLSAPTAMSPHGAAAGNYFDQFDPPPAAASSPNSGLDEPFVPTLMTSREANEYEYGCRFGADIALSGTVVPWDKDRATEFYHQYCSCEAKGIKATRERGKTTIRAYEAALSEIDTSCFRTAIAVAGPPPQRALFVPDEPSSGVRTAVPPPVYTAPPSPRPPVVPLVVPTAPRPPAWSTTDCEWVGDFLECDNGSRHTTCEEVAGFLHCDSFGD